MLVKVLNNLLHIIFINIKLLHWFGLYILQYFLINILQYNVSKHYIKVNYIKKNKLYTHIQDILAAYLELIVYYVSLGYDFHQFFWSVFVYILKIESINVIKYIHNVEKKINKQILIKDLILYEQRYDFV